MTPRPEGPETIGRPDHLLSCICASTRDDQVVIRLSGEIDMASAPLLHDVLGAACELSASVALDMAEVTFMDSSGIKEIALANQRTKVTVRGASDAVRKCLTLCGLAELLERVDAA